MYEYSIKEEKKMLSFKQKIKKKIRFIIKERKKFDSYSTVHYHMCEIDSNEGYLPNRE